MAERRSALVSDMHANTILGDMQIFFWSMIGALQK